MICFLLCCDGGCDLSASLPESLHKAVFIDRGNRRVTALPGQVRFFRRGGHDLRVQGQAFAGDDSAVPDDRIAGQFTGKDVDLAGISGFLLLFPGNFCLLHI